MKKSRLFFLAFALFPLLDRLLCLFASFEPAVETPYDKAGQNDADDNQDQGGVDVHLRNKFHPHIKSLFKIYITYIRATKVLFWDK